MVVEKCEAGLWSVRWNLWSHGFLFSGYLTKIIMLFTRGICCLDCLEGDQFADLICCTRNYIYLCFYDFLKNIYF